MVYSFFIMRCYLITIRFLSELTNTKTGAGRAVGLVAFAMLRLLGLRFYFHLTPGSAADAAAPGALLYFSGILLLFDVQSSTTEKEQKDRHLLFLRRGGARTPGWDYTRKIVRDPSLPVFQRLRVLSRIVDRNISILRTSEIENETELQYHNSV